MKIYILKRYEQVWFNRFDEELAKERIDKELLKLKEDERSLVEFEIYEEELIGPESIF